MALPTPEFDVVMSIIHRLMSFTRQLKEMTMLVCWLIFVKLFGTKGDSE